jgi:uncharacterized phage protein gp47/JayE
MAISDLIYIDNTGVVTPDYPAVLETIKSQYAGIYGADVYLDADSQDGQFISILSLQIYDLINLFGLVYNSFSPTYAQADALSRNVKINGIARKVATYSTVDLTIVGVPGTTIINGQAEDTLSQKWDLPASVVIPSDGDITVTATAAKIGTVSAAAGTVIKIATPTLGWQSVTNASAAAEGAPVESDAELRIRQKHSTALPSLSVLEGITGAIADIAGVTQYRSYENDSTVTDANGIPGHSIAIVVEGGDAQTIGETIALKKTPGTGTYGTTSVETFDKYNVPNVIYFFRPTTATISVEVTISALQGYTSGYAASIAADVAATINRLSIGDDVLITKLYVPANLPGTQAGSTFDITQIRIKKNSGSYTTGNITIAFNEVAECASINVSVIVS